MMLLHLSTDDAWNASYTDSAGHILYKFESSSSLSKDEMTLYRFDAPGTDDKALVARILFDTVTKEKSTIVMMRTDHDSDSFSNSSKGGEEKSEGKAMAMPAGDILRRSGPAGFTLGSYPAQAFTAPDGNEYEWVFGYGTCSLHPIPIPNTSRTIDSELPPPIVSFTHGESHILSKSRPPTLEVSEAYEGILDTALVMLGYLERVRKRDEKRRKGPAFFGGGSWALMSR